MVFCVGTHNDKEKEDRSDGVGTYGGMRAAIWDGCWNWRTLNVIVSILKSILWRTGSICRSERTGAMRQKRDFSATTRASVFWTSCRWAKFETEGPARRELYSSPAGILLAYYSGEGRSKVTQCTNVKVRGLACLRNLLIKRHFRVEISTQILDWWFANLFLNDYLRQIKIWWQTTCLSEARVPNFNGEKKGMA